MADSTLIVSIVGIALSACREDRRREVLLAWLDEATVLLGLEHDPRLDVAHR
jgi:hypothetical protein